MRTSLGFKRGQHVHKKKMCMNPTCINVMTKLDAYTRTRIRSAPELPDAINALTIHPTAAPSRHSLRAGRVIVGCIVPLIFCWAGGGGNGGVASSSPPPPE
jgi:hypothetical protein